MATPDRAAVELTRILLAAFFGTQVARVATSLLTYGRMELASISRRADVHLRSTKQALAVMLQHNIVRFSTMPDNDRERTFYEVDWRQALHLLRAGKELWWASKELSSEAAAVVKYVLLLGRVKASDLTSAFVSASKKSHSEKAQEFEGLLVALLQQRFLKVASLNDTKPHEDLKILIMNEELKIGNSGTIPDAKRTHEIELRVDNRLASLQNDTYSPKIGLKRKPDTQDSFSSRKRVRALDSLVDPEISLRVDHDKFLVYQRSEDLVDLCRRRLGVTPAAVYRHVLKLVEHRIFTCDQDTSSFTVTTLQIARTLSSDIDVHSVWAQHPASKGRAKAAKIPISKKRSRLRSKSESGEDESMEEEEPDSEDEQFVIDDEDEVDSDEDFDTESNSMQAVDGQRITMINRFLELFVSDSLRLLNKVGTRSMGEWQFDFRHLGNVLRDIEIETTIQQKFGELAPRLLRIIKDKVKVDEKQLSSIALLKQKDIRHILTALHESDVLDLQEVPKRLDRQPSMTYFLWGHNVERATATLSMNVLRAIVRVHQRLQHELNVNRRLLDKAQRTDVRNREAEYLSKEELSCLRRIRAIEDKLLAQSSRLANSYSKLVDYA